MNNVERIYYMLQENDCNHWFRDNADMLRLAEYLDKKGVIAPQSKVGEKIYIHQFDNKLKKVVVECEIIEHNKAEELFKVKLADGRILTLLFQFIGKTVFLTREEAEQALKGGAE